VEQAVLFRLAADAVLLLHALFVVFVIAGLVLVLAGRPLGWRWIYHFGFRVTHLCAIGVVVLLSWLGAACPLTDWEMKLRAQAGDATYTGAFIAHWVEELLYYRAPDWVFAALYTAFGALVVASWFWVRPRH
jgi:hypothetical protein